MAITRAQQAKQMLQDGGMLVQPGFGGMRQGYRGDAAAAAGAPGTADAGPAGDPGEGPASGQGPASDNRSDFMGSKGKTRGPSNVGNVGGVIAPAVTKFGPKLMRNALINQALRKAFGPVGPVVGGIIGAMSKGNKGLPGTSEEDDDTQSFAGGGLAQLDTNRLAVKLLADGGFLGEEDRQAYGLGDIVKKVFKPVRKVASGVTGAFKKIIKSPVGRTAIALALASTMGPSAPAFFKGLTAAQKAALISATTTAGGQVAAGDDLDLKEIGLSAALAYGGSKLTTPAVGVDGKAFNAATTSGATGSNVLTDALGGEYLAGGNLPAPETIGTLAGQGDTGTVIARNILQSPETGILQSAKEFLTEPSLARTALTIGVPSIIAGAATAQQPEETLDDEDRGEGLNIPEYRRDPFGNLAIRFRAEGGSTEAKEPVAKKVMPLLDMDGMEKDYRETGGFVDMGRMEKADDVPARLSKNEFVFTADAVRNAGDGSVDKGAEVMYNMMKNLEAGGDVSEESQGLEGARRMFQTSQRLEEVL